MMYYATQMVHIKKANKTDCSLEMVFNNIYLTIIINFHHQYYCSFDEVLHPYLLAVMNLMKVFFH